MGYAYDLLEDRRMIMALIYLKSSTFLSLKIFVDTDWCQEWKIKTSLLEINQGKHITLLFDTVRFEGRAASKL